MTNLALKKRDEVTVERLPALHPPKRSYLLPFLFLAGVTTLVHILLALHYPLSEDETYYWDWSRNFDWGYYDQGPMIAWWIRGFCSVFGNTSFSVRAGAIVVTLGIQLVSFGFLRKLFDDRSAYWGIFILSVTPLALVGGFVFTYDALLILFWAVALAGLAAAYFRGHGVGWAVLGAALGLGMLSKLTMALFLPCGLIFLLLAPGGKRILKSPYPYLSALAGLGVFLPNLWWQMEHGWPTFSHIRTLSKATQGKAFYVRTADFLGSQVAVITPVLLTVLAVALWLSWKKRNDPKLLFLWCFSAPILILFLASTANGKVLANWTASGWYGACLLGGAWLATGYSTDRWSKWLKAGMAISVAMSLMAVCPEVLSTMGIQLPEPVNRPSNRMFGGEELALGVQALRARGGDFKIVATEYQQVSRLGFYLPGQPRIVCLFSSTRLNDYIFRQSETALQNGDNAILVLETPMRKNERAVLQKAFQRVEEVPSVVPVFRKPVHSEPVRSYFLYRLYGFLPGPGGPLVDPRP